MNNTEKLNHLLALREEISILEKRIQPQATGYIHTTINTLRDRVEELRSDLDVELVKLNSVAAELSKAI